MMKMRLIAILIIATFIKPCVIYAENKNSALFVTRSMNCVWRIYSDGNLEKLSCFQDSSFEYRGNNYYGENYPLISPDQRHVAVIRHDDLWIFEPDTKKLIRITQVTKPYTNKYLSIEVNTKSWSWDGRKLLYSVSSGDPRSGDDGFDRKAKPAKYGFYIYDVKDKSRKFISENLSDNFGKLFPNFNRVFLAWPQDGTTLINGNKINKELSSPQIDISRDGKWLVANTKLSREAFGKDPRCQIVKIDLNNYNIIPITPVGSWAEYQWPKLSPSGKHILYQWLSGLADKQGKGNLVKSIVVDGKNIYTSTGDPQGLSDYSWIDDNTIAFTSISMNNEKEIIIIDSVTGEIKGQHKIGKAR